MGQLTQLTRRPVQLIIVKIRMQPVVPIGVFRKMCHQPGAVRGVRSEVQRRPNLLSADILSPSPKLLVATSVQRPHLARSWPFAVAFLGGQHPDRRPKPIAQRQFGAYDKAAVFKVEAWSGSKQSALNRRSWKIYVANTLTVVATVSGEHFLV